MIIIDIIRKLLNNLLLVAYKYTGGAILLTVLSIAVWVFFDKYGIKSTCRLLKRSLKKSGLLRNVFGLSFFMFMLIYMTLLCRFLSPHPLHDVIGFWGIYNDNGELYTASIEEGLLFIPICLLSVSVLRNTKYAADGYGLIRIITSALVISFGISLAIELLQLFLRVGCFQLSDLGYSTAGGMLGGFIYYIICKAGGRHRNSN